MTDLQEKILEEINVQRILVQQFPDDPVELAVLESLYTDLRRTFRMVQGERHSYSPARAVLKRVK